MYIYIYIYIYVQGFAYSRDGGNPAHHQKILLIPRPPPRQIFIRSSPKVNSNQEQNKNVIFSYSNCSCTIFVLILYSFEIQLMLILILTDVQYSQNAVFSFEKFSNRQNHSSSGSHNLVKKIPQQCSLLFDTKSGKLLKIQVKKNSNFTLKPRQRTHS